LGVVWINIGFQRGWPNEMLDYRVYSNSQFSFSGSRAIMPSAINPKPIKLMAAKLAGKY
jgi:hypothetical protein